MDYNTIAAIGSGIIAIAGGGIVAKVVAPAMRKLGQVEQLLSDAESDVQDAQRVAADLQTLLAGAQNGSIGATALVGIQSDAKSAAAAFEKTVSDAKALVS